MYKYSYRNDETETITAYGSDIVAILQAFPTAFDIEETNKRYQVADVYEGSYQREQAFESVEDAKALFKSWSQEFQDTNLYGTDGIYLWDMETLTIISQYTAEEQ